MCLSTSNTFSKIVQNSHLKDIAEDSTWEFPDRSRSTRTPQQPEQASCSWNQESAAEPCPLRAAWTQETGSTECPTQHLAQSRSPAHIPHRGQPGPAPEYPLGGACNDLTEISKSLVALGKGRCICQEKMAPHSSTLAWKIPWTEEPGRLQSMGSLKVGHN